MKHNKKAFTLIELLVVVLIIGILSAIALPMYEKAVEKSRAAEAIQLLRYMHNQGEICVLERGKESCKRGNKMEDMGIEMPANLSCAWDGYDNICCSKHWCYDSNLDSWSEGDTCEDGDSIQFPVARRVDGLTGKEANEGSYSWKYVLQVGNCPENYGKIVCHGDKYCKMFSGDGNPI